MRIIIIIFSILFFLVIGCKKDDLIVNPAAFKVIIPIAVGSRWDYTLNVYDSTGIQQAANTVSYNITKDTIINFSRWYKYSEIITNSQTQSSEFFCANTSSGFYSIKNSVPFLIFKYPASIHDSYYVNNVINYLHIISIDTSITISLGTFHCYAFDSYQQFYPNMLGGSYEIMYVSPEIGIVKTEIYASFQIGKKQFLWASAELTSAELK